MTSFDNSQSALLLRKQLLELKKSPVSGFSAGLSGEMDDIYKWDVLIIGPPDTIYDGGFFKAALEFPKDYPQRPPKMRFTSQIWHPNIDKDGSVCISILHEPGSDTWGYERPEERWLPVHTVESILLSVISMLANPNCESPANVDAAKMLRDNYEEYKQKVTPTAKTQKYSPEVHESSSPTPKALSSHSAALSRRTSKTQSRKGATARLRTIRPVATFAVPELDERLKDAVEFCFSADDPSVPLCGQSNTLYFQVCCDPKSPRNPCCVRPQTWVWVIALFAGVVVSVSLMFVFVRFAK